MAYTCSFAQNIGWPRALGTLGGCFACLIGQPIHNVHALHWNIARSVLSSTDACPRPTVYPSNCHIVVYRNGSETARQMPSNAPTCRHRFT